MNTRERCIRTVKERNRENGCKSTSRLGTKRCVNPFAVCSKVKMADSELAEAGRALRHTIEA